MTTFSIVQLVLCAALTVEAIWYMTLIYKKHEEYTKLINLYEEFKESVRKYNERVGRDQGKDI